METKKSLYNLFVSQPVISKASDGDQQAAKSKEMLLPVISTPEELLF